MNHKARRHDDVRDCLGRVAATPRPIHLIIKCELLFSLFKCELVAI